MYTTIYSVCKKSTPLYIVVTLKGFKGFEKMKKITVGIPAFHAQDHICDALSSIQIQTMVQDIAVVIAKDDPNDDYEFVRERYPELDITILDCEKNTGPGLARQRALDAARTRWITFIDADDIFVGAFAIENLYRGIEPNCIEVMGTFLQEVDDNPNVRVIPIGHLGHPWVFGRLYDVEFLRTNNVRFSELRAMEDGCFNSSIRLITEGTSLFIKQVNAEVYLWRVGSEHSITRIGVDNNGIPQYNFDLCAVGATTAAIEAVRFARGLNPFNGNINKYIVEMMLNSYFTYVECIAKKPVFAEQCFFNAKRFYHECYKEIESQISKKILTDLYTSQLAQKAQDLIGIIPEITFFDFMDAVRENEYGGDAEFKDIRSRLPEEIIQNDLKTGVLGNSEEE